MRTRLLAALCILAMSPRVRAQDTMDPSQEGSSETLSETEAQDVQDPPTEGDRVRMKDPNARESAPGEVHTVVKGDTLWDLSQKYLGSPWYWPKVWSYNPEIANPHWIYPGNQIRFAMAGEEVPTRIDATGEEATEELDAEQLEEAEARNELAGPDGSGLSVAGKIGYQGGNAQTGAGRMVMVNGFVTDKEIDEAGRISGSFEEKEMLSYPDRAYVTFKKRADARIGDKYLVFRTEENPVRHPISGKKLGYMTHILGTMKVVALNEKIVTAQVMGSRDEIVRGNLVGPAGESLDRQIAPKANEKELQAVVVTALVPFLTLLGEHHVIVIDKGAADGVQPGNTFTAIRQSDLGGDFTQPHKNPREDLPKEDIGTCMALEVKDKFSTCIVTRSIREIVPGDRLEMRVNGGAQASR